METPGRQFERLLAGEGFSAGEIALLSRYFQMVLKWNTRLHLTTITEPRDFLTRHVLESALLARQIAPEVREVWDLGSGLGIPGVVVAILRPDLTVFLVEASKKKALFLDEVAASLPLPNLRVRAERIESLAPLPEAACLTARAVEEMERLLPKMVDLASGARQLLLLGGDRVADGLDAALPPGQPVERTLLPGSSRRFLLSAIRST